jgi:hypothetical protein
MITEFLITPATIGGNRYCCDPETRMTDGILSGSAALVEPGVYSFTEQFGSVKFAVCCGSQVEFTWEGTADTSERTGEGLVVLNFDIESEDPGSTVFSGVGFPTDENADLGAFLTPGAPFGLTDAYGSYRPCAWTFEIYVQLPEGTTNVQDFKVTITVT